VKIAVRRAFPGQKLTLARAFRVKYDQNYGFGIEDVLYNPTDECTFLVPLYEDDMLAFFQDVCTYSLLKKRKL
jgi:hypothetical protein